MPDMPVMMNLLVSRPKPPISAAMTGTAMSATRGDIRFSMMLASSITTVNVPSAASIASSHQGSAAAAPDTASAALLRSN
jgi:hypothetical protein